MAVRFSPMGSASIRGLKKGALRWARGRQIGLRKVVFLSGFLGDFLTIFFVITDFFERGAFARQFILVVGYKTRLQLKIICGIP